MADSALSTDRLLAIFRRMLEIRAFEDEVEKLFLKNLVRGSTHLATGQEAVAVGACFALESGDTMTCTYRGHAAVLAMGAPLEGCMAEILGKATGLCGGRGGSMHLTDLSVGALGSFAIVGANLPFAVGAAFAAKYRDSRKLSLSFFGDGATNIGAFHESMNLAAIWKLPVLFVCENNRYGEYSPIASTTPIDSLADRAASYAMPGHTIDGNDAVVVHDAVSEAAQRARAGEGPTFIEALTYRHKGHSRSDPATYRPAGELERWLAEDPLLKLEARLTAAGVDDEEISRERQQAIETVKEATERALDAPDAEYESAPV